MPGLAADKITEIDTSNILADVLALPEHVTDALWRVDSSGVEQVLDQVGAGFSSLIVCGMGGSAIGGDLAAAALGDQLTRPLHVVRGYELPSWATSEALVLCASYSGNTEETLACFDAADALGASRVVVTAGGKLAEVAREQDVPVIPLPGVFQPRAAVAYMLVAALEVAAHAGVAPAMRAELDAAAAHLTALATEWGPEADSDSLAKRAAQRMHGSAPCIYGAGSTTAISRRWKTQLNENAKLPAFWAELPEADHNELVGWGGSDSVGKFIAIFLEDADQHPRVRQRIELTAQAVEQAGAGALRIESRGDNRIERLLSLVLLGDLASVYLAVLRGVDPTPVEAIERLKKALTEG